MMRFTLPRDMYYGKGALEDLKNLSGKKAIVVSGGSSMRKAGFLDQIEGYLKEAGHGSEISLKALSRILP